MRVWHILHIWLAFTIRLGWVWVSVANNVWCSNCLLYGMLLLAMVCFVHFPGPSLSAWQALFYWTLSAPKSRQRDLSPLSSRSLRRHWKFCDADIFSAHTPSRTGIVHPPTHCNQNCAWCTDFARSISCSGVFFSVAAMGFSGCVSELLPEVCSVHSRYLIFWQ